MPPSEPSVGWARPEIAWARLTREQWLTVWFYLWVPILIGFLLGWVRAGRTATFPLDIALLYWILVSVISTNILGLTTAAVATLARRARLPLWVTLFGGQLLGGLVLIEPAMRALRWAMRTWVYPTFPIERPWDLWHVLMTLPSNTLLWIGLNLLFFHVLGMTRFGYAPATTPASDLPTASTSPTFMSRVKPERRGALLALEADGHYLRVFTDAGSDLILYRLADAIAEVPAADGERVHRSWWVADRALSPERHRDKVTLSIGLDIPVSRSYRIAARKRGWIVGPN